MKPFIVGVGLFVLAFIVLVVVGMNVAQTLHPPSQPSRNPSPAGTASSGVAGKATAGRLPAPTHRGEQSQSTATMGPGGLPPPAAPPAWPPAGSLPASLAPGTSPSSGSSPSNDLPPVPGSRLPSFGALPPAAAPPVPAPLPTPQVPIQQPTSTSSTTKSSNTSQ